jgi:UDP-2,3-diacylglucosamine pyrophosphatase LpxH
MSAGHSESRYRSIWISDIHLGTRECQAESLLNFLRFNESEYLYLVGDIIDGWRLRKSWFWPQSHNDVVQKLLRKARKGTRVTYIPGNHDQWLQDYTQIQFGEVTVLNETIHKTVEGRRLLVLHGDAFEKQIQYAWWRAQLAGWGYDRMLTIDHYYNAGRARLGYSRRSFAASLKSKLAEAVQFVRNFEDAAAIEAGRRGVDGIVCGHIHTPRLREINGVLYCNDGDWVENCTAAVEHQDGRLEVIAWTGPQGERQPDIRANTGRERVPAGVGA